MSACLLSLSLCLSLSLASSHQGFLIMCKTLNPALLLLPLLVLHFTLMSRLSTTIGSPLLHLIIMSRRQTWSLLHTVQKSKVLRTRSIRHISSTTTAYAHPYQKTLHPFLQENRKLILTPQVAHSTLLNCPSDLIALSFFIWCVKQHIYFRNSQAIDHMVCVVDRLTDRHRTVKAIVRELGSVGVVPQAHIFLVLLRIYWRGMNYRMVFQTVLQMETLGFKPNLFARNVLMDAFFKDGSPDKGIKVFKETPSPNFLSFNIALCNLCKLNDLINAMDVLRMMMKLGYYPNVETFEMLLNCFCKVGRLRTGYQLLGLMITLGISLSVNAWSILVQGFCQLHQPVMAANLLDKMVESGCSPNVVTYTTLFKELIESQRVSSAFDILNVMKHRGCAIDLVLCNVLIDSYSKIGQHDEAINVFVCLPKWNLVPDSYTLCSLLPALYFSKIFDILRKLFGEPFGKIDQVARNSLLNYFVKDGSPFVAMNLYDVMIDQDIIADKYTFTKKRFDILRKLFGQPFGKIDQVACNSLLNYFVKDGSPFVAVNLYGVMIDQDIIADKYTFTSLIRALCGVGRIDEASNVYHGVIKSCTGLDPHFHTAIMDGLIRSGRYNEANRLFKRAIIEQYPVDVVSYTIAIHGLLKRGRTAEASDLYDEMKGVGLSPNARTYRVMIHGFSANRDNKMVKMLLDEIVEAAVQLDYRTRIRLNCFLLKSHLSSSCIDQLNKLRNLGSIPDDTRHELLFDGPAYGVNVCDSKHSPSQSYLGNYLFVDSSSSDDLSDVAVSVG